MTQADTLCTIFYADGRQEGPISALVVQDLIQAGVLGPQDKVALEGQVPMSVTSHPLFASAKPTTGRPGGASTGVKLSSRSRGGSSSAVNARRRNAVAQLAKLNASTPSGSFMRMGGEAPSVDAPASLSPQSSPGASISRLSGSMPAIRGTSSQAAIRLGGPAGTPPSGGALVPAKPSEASLKLMSTGLKKGPIFMRDKLLMATLYDILGVSAKTSPPEITRAYVSRARTIKDKFSSKATSGEARMSLIDVMNILQTTHDTLTAPDSRSSYEHACAEASRELSFQNHVPFTFADEDARIVPSVPPHLVRMVEAMAPVAPKAAASVPVPAPAPAAPAPAPLTTAPRAASAPRKSTGLRKMVAAPAPPTPDGQSLEAMEESTTLMSVSELAKAMNSGPVEINKPPEDPSEGLILDDGGDDGLGAIFSSPASDAQDLFGATGDGGMSIDDMLSAIGGDEPSSAPARPAPPSPGPPSSPDILGAQPAQDGSFSKKELEKGPESLRDKLLMSPLTDVLGVDIGAPSAAFKQAHTIRQAQIKKAFPTTGFGLSEDDRLAAKDILNILNASFEVLGDDAKRIEYQNASTERGRLLSFQNHVPFTFAFQEKEAAKAANAPVKTSRNPSLKDVPVAGPPASRTSSPGMPAVRASGKHKAMSPKQAAASKDDKKDKKDKKKKNQFKGAEWREKGDPFKGKLVWGIGRADRGLKHVVPVYLAAFLLSFVMVSILGMGQYELELRLGDPIIYLRNGTLIFLAMVGLVGLRRESPVRFGLAPKILPTLAAIPAAAILAVAASAIARFDINAGATLESLMILLAVRAIGEAIFFHGFVTRTLLIEFKQPAFALMMGSFLYGLYSLTYATLISGTPFNTLYAVMIYGFGGGFPMAVIYWQTRSVIIVALCQFAILFMAAYGGLQYANNMAGV